MNNHYCGHCHCLFSAGDLVGGKCAACRNLSPAKNATMQKQIDELGRKVALLQVKIRELEEAVDD